MSFAEDIRAAKEAEDRDYRRTQHPTGWEPSVSLDGDTGFIVTEPMVGEPVWADVLKVWNLDPTEYEVVGNPQMRAWDVQTKNGIERLFYYRANIARITKRSDVDALLKQLRKGRKKDIKTTSTNAYVVAVGDLQLGEWNKDGGTDKVIERFTDKLDQAIQTLKMLRKLGKVGGDIYAPWLGDCIQGFVSQGGRLAWRTDATLTEQFRIYRRLIAYQVEELAPFADKLVVIGIPGNHDEAVRQPVSTRGDDSWAVEGVVAAADAFARASGYDHVVFVTPQVDDLTVTLDMCGTVVGMAHGHQWRGAAHNAHGWWAKQSHGRTAVGDADLLLCGHRHHLYVEAGGAKTVIQVPSLAGDSAYWVSQHGDRSGCGLVSLVVGGGLWSDLAIF